MNEVKLLLAPTLIIYIKMNRRFSSIHVKCNIFGIVSNRLNFLIFLIHSLDCFIEEKYLRKRRQYCWFLWYLHRLSETLSNKLSSIPINTISNCYWNKGIEYINFFTLLDATLNIQPLCQVFSVICYLPFKAAV